MAGNLVVGRQKVEWARSRMPVLEEVRRRFVDQRPFEGLTVSMVLHVEAKTAALALAIQAGGAEVHLAAGNPLSTDDDAVAALRAEGVHTLAEKGESLAAYRAGIEAMREANPHVIIDDGADLVALVHSASGGAGRVRGSTEETTTGVTRLRALEREGKLRFPAIDVNDAQMKHLFDNRYGTGQSTLDGIASATNLLIAGKVAVVAGYGWCGKGVASRLRGMGADVIVTEVDPVRALEARLEGFRVMRMLDAVRLADLIVTVTGNTGIVRREHFQVMKDGCLLANAGHFDVEVSRTDLEGMAVSHGPVRPHVERYDLPDGRRVYLLGEGRLINLAAGQGHPVEIMDLSFALQALSAEHIAKHGPSMAPKVHAVPESIDLAVARAALTPFGVAIDDPTEEQVRYARSWELGT
ncbi:MAG: adenosylhomocysteinase [Thermoplasmata archaeon]